MLKPKIKLIIALLSGICFVAIPLLAQASGSFIPCGGYQANGAPEHACTVVDLFIMVARVTNWLLAIIGIYATYVIISHGFWLALSQGDEEAIKTRKAGIQNAILGFILATMGFLFMNTAVNYLLHSKCPLNLSDPLSYLTIKDYDTCK